MRPRSCVKRQRPDNRGNEDPPRRPRRNVQRRWGPSVLTSPDPRRVKDENESKKNGKKNGSTIMYHCSWTLCNYESNWKENVGRHEKMLHDPVPHDFPCRLCEPTARSYKFHVSFFSHLEVEHSGQRLECPTCSYKNEDLSKLKAHVLQHVTPSEEQIKVTVKSERVAKRKIMKKGQVRKQVKTSLSNPRTVRRDALLQCGFQWCNFETEHTSSLCRHRRAHRKVTEVKGADLNAVCDDEGTTAKKSTVEAQAGDQASREKFETCVKHDSESIPKQAQSSRKGQEEEEVGCPGPVKSKETKEEQKDGAKGQGLPLSPSPPTAAVQHKCPICGNKFPTRLLMYQHIKTHRKVADNVENIPKPASTAASGSQILRNSVRVTPPTKNEQISPGASPIVTEPENLKSSNKISTKVGAIPTISTPSPISNQTEDLPFACSHCEYRSKWLNNVLRHEKRHTNGVQPTQDRPKRHSRSVRVTQQRKKRHSDDSQANQQRKEPHSNNTQSSNHPENGHSHGIKGSHHSENGYSNGIPDYQQPGRGHSCDTQSWEPEKLVKSEVVTTDQQRKHDSKEHSNRSDKVQVGGTRLLNPRKTRGREVSAATKKFKSNDGLKPRAFPVPLIPNKDGKYGCEQCEYVTPTRHNLRLHLAVHSTEKPFACSNLGCDFRSKWVQNLRTHYQVCRKTSRKVSCSSASPRKLRGSSTKSTPLPGRKKARKDSHSTLLRENPVDCAGALETSESAASFVKEAPHHRSDAVPAPREQHPAEEALSVWQTVADAGKESLSYEHYINVRDATEWPLSLPEIADATKGLLTLAGAVDASKESPFATPAVYTYEESPLQLPILVPATSECPRAQLEPRNAIERVPETPNSGTLDSFERRKERQRKPPKIKIEPGLQDDTVLTTRDDWSGGGGGELYGCPQCDYQSRWRTNLKSHLMVHVETKPFGCPYPDCNYRSKWSQCVRQHYRIVHKAQLPPKASLKEDAQAVADLTSLFNSIICSSSSELNNNNNNGLKRSFQNADVNASGKKTPPRRRSSDLKGSKLSHKRSSVEPKETKFPKMKRPRVKREPIEGEGSCRFCNYLKRLAKYLTKHMRKCPACFVTPGGASSQDGRSIPVRATVKIEPSGHY